MSQRSAVAGASAKPRDQSKNQALGFSVASKFQAAVCPASKSSPSASSALRAKEALRTDRPQYFDVPHERQELVTEDERQMAAQQPQTIQDVMRNVVVYVEMRSGTDNRSEGIKTVIAQLGATVNDRLLRNTTHVVFKDGLISTYQKARNWNIPVVSILWVEACRKYTCLMDPGDYMISNVERYERPELYEKMRKQKSMQPNAEETRRRKNVTPKTATPNSKSITATSAVADNVSNTTKIRWPYKPKDNLPEIYAKFTQQLRDAENGNDDDDDNSLIGENSKILEIIRNSPVVMDHQDNNPSIPKVATGKTRRTLFNYFTPASQNTSSSQSTDASEVTIPETQDLTQEEEAKSNMIKETSIHKTVTPVRLTRRNSMTSKTQTVQKTAESMISSQEASAANTTKTPARLTRRNSFTTPATPIVTPAKTPRKTMRKTMFPSVEEEPSSDSSNMNLTNIPPNTKQQTIEQRTTCYAPINMDVTRTPTALESLNELMTTPLTKERPSTLLSSVLRRKTMYTPQLIQETFVEQATQPEHSTPTTVTAVGAENPLGMSATDKPVSRRRTLFTPNRVVEYKRDRLLESEQLLNLSLDPINEPTPATPSAPLSRTISFETPVQEIAQPRSSSQVCCPISPDTPPFGPAPAIDEPTTVLEAYNRTFATPTFSSTRMPVSSNKRRTIFEMSKEIIEHRVRSINMASARKNRSMSESDLTSELDEAPASMKTLDPQCTASSPQLNKTGGVSHIYKEKPSLDQPTVQRKRKLFAPSTESLNFDTASPIDDIIPLSASKRPKPPVSVKSSVINKTAIAKPAATKKASTTIRRRTTMDFATNKIPKMASSGVVDHQQRLDKFLVSTNMHREQISVIQEAVNALGTFQLENNVTGQTTHLVTLEPLRTVNLLRGLIRGVWILRYDWIVESSRCGRWLEEEPFEVRDFSAAVSICRTERQAFGPRYKIDIFADAPPIFIVASKCNCPALRELVTQCGGLVTTRRTEAKYVISDSYEPPAPGAAEDALCVSSTWILDSISIAKRKKVNKYVLTATSV